MVRVIVYVTVFIIATFFSKIKAQNQSQIPCSSIEYSQFNFWIGKWNVYNTKGELIGINNIVKTPNACAIQENWESKSSKSKGTSYNYYNEKDNSWNQVWIDNSGFSLVLKGNFENEKMILKSDLITGEKGTYKNVIEWKKNEDNSVTQTWNYTDEQGKIIKEVFKGIYKKQ
ncbi:conserved hypothetical protein [Tenacibaculum sp. 190524A02b]|uniref:Lipocalin-like domain-containing protein n=1 Tax=Tenacibaculum vairaonense TaxID=3137860 RepID=A0ABP1FBA2_9FLAO